MKHMKIENGWINQTTPPNGYYLDDQGVVRKNHATHTVAAVDSNADGCLLPPSPSQNHPPVPPMITTDPNSAGKQ